MTNVCRRIAAVAMVAALGSGCGAVDRLRFTQTVPDPCALVSEERVQSPTSPPLVGLYRRGADGPLTMTCEWSGQPYGSEPTMRIEVAATGSGACPDDDEPGQRIVEVDGQRARLGRDVVGLPTVQFCRDDVRVRLSRPRTVLGQPDPERELLGWMADAVARWDDVAQLADVPEPPPARFATLPAMCKLPIGPAVDAIVGAPEVTPLGPTDEPRCTWRGPSETVSIVAGPPTDLGHRGVSAADSAAAEIAWWPTVVGGATPVDGVGAPAVLGAPVTMGGTGIVPFEQPAISIAVDGLLVVVGYTDVSYTDVSELDAELPAPVTPEQQARREAALRDFAAAVVAALRP